jgi:hypothetical protein
MGSRYVIVKCGALVRGESMNVGVLTWATPEGATFETPVDPTTPVLQRMLDDWGYVMAAFPRYVTTEIRDDVLARMKNIQTYEDYQRTLERCGPYTPFEFSDVRPATTTAEELLHSTWKFFFEER